MRGVRGIKLLLPRRRGRTMRMGDPLFVPAPAQVGPAVTGRSSAEETGKYLNAYLRGSKFLIDSRFEYVTKKEINAFLDAFLEAQ